MEIEGNLRVTAYIDCPSCDNIIDLFEDHHLVEDGWVYEILFDSDGFGCENFSGNYKFSFGEDYVCPKCKKVLNITKIHW
jgi:hypothetical protein